MEMSTPENHHNRLKVLNLTNFENKWGKKEEEEGKLEPKQKHKSEEEDEGSGEYTLRWQAAYTARYYEDLNSELKSRHQLIAEILEEIRQKQMEVASILQDGQQTLAQRTHSVFIDISQEMFKTEATVRSESENIIDQINNAKKEMEKQFVHQNNIVLSIREAMEMTNETPKSLINMDTIATKTAAEVTEKIQHMLEQNQIKKNALPALDMVSWIHEGTTSVIRKMCPIIVKMAEINLELNERVIIDPGASASYTRRRGAKAERWPAGHEVRFTLMWQKIESGRQNSAIGTTSLDIRVTTVTPPITIQAYLVSNHSGIDTVLGRDFISAYVEAIQHRHRLIRLRSPEMISVAVPFEYSRSFITRVFADLGHEEPEKAAKNELNGAKLAGKRVQLEAPRAEDRHRCHSKTRSRSRSVMSRRRRSKSHSWY